MADSIDFCMLFPVPMTLQETWGYTMVRNIPNDNYIPRYWEQLISTTALLEIDRRPHSFRESRPFREIKDV